MCSGGRRRCTLAPNPSSMCVCVCVLCAADSRPAHSPRPVLLFDSSSIQVLQHRTILAEEQFQQRAKRVLEEVAKNTELHRVALKTQKEAKETKVGCYPPALAAAQPIGSAVFTALVMHVSCAASPFTLAFTNVILTDH